MCEILGCLPSEIKEKHPNMTLQDRMFISRYASMRWVYIAKMLGMVKE